MSDEGGCPRLRCLSGAQIWRPCARHRAGFPVAGGGRMHRRSLGQTLG